MFIQVIEGRTSAGEELRRQFDRWHQELRPGAKGYLGSTGGVAEDGTVIFLARFEDEGAARANSERPEQGEWWNETAKHFDGEVTFRDCPDVDIMFDGGSDDAGFVQVMQGRSRDRDRLKTMEDEFLPQLREMRPDLIGAVRAWDGDHFVQAIYFRSEAEAREGETRMTSEQQGDAANAEEYMSLVEDVTYIDLKEPWLQSP